MSEIIIIGAWNTGTNLIWKIFSNSKCININTDKNILIQPQHYKIWKHEPIIQTIRQLIITNPNSIIIIMYRNILNWIASMLKSPYEVNFDNINSVATIQRKNNKSICFKNILTLYITYYSNYKKLIQEYSNVIFLNYNRIIDDVDKAFDYINNKLMKYNLTLTSYDNFIATLNKPAKPHGQSVSNYLEARNKKNKEEKHIKKMIFQNYPTLKAFLNIANEICQYYENEY
jgi:hypothetical protein